MTGSPLLLTFVLFPFSIFSQTHHSVTTSLKETSALKIETAYIPEDIPEVYGVERASSTKQERQNDGACGTNIQWSLSSGVLSITGSGEMTNYSSSYSYSYPPWYSSRESITEVMIEDGVTSIGDYAFYSCSSLTSVTIPGSVIIIGSNAFRSCSSLTPITIPDSVTAIGNYAFQYCSSLTSITIGNGVSSIGTDAFSSCYQLKTVYYIGTPCQYYSISIATPNNALDVLRHYTPPGSEAAEIVFAYDYGTGVLTISGSGYMDDYPSSSDAPLVFMLPFDNRSGDRGWSYEYWKFCILLLFFTYIYYYST